MNITTRNIQSAESIIEGDEDAMKRLYDDNTRFVESIAKQYQDRGKSLEELIDAGNKGLSIAVKKYNPERGFKFIAYAVWWIRQSIIASINEPSYTEDVVHKEEIDAVLDTLKPREKDILRKYFGIGEPQQTSEEIGNDMNLTRERVRQIKERAIRNIRYRK